MNRKADTGEGIYNNLVYFIVGIFVFFVLLVFVNSQKSGAATWEDYYAKEIVKVIDLAKPGDQIKIDVQKPTTIAKKNKMGNLTDIFSFNNQVKDVCVKLKAGRKSCYGYFNEINVSNYSIEFGVPGNILLIKMQESSK
jgi:hypothetical protein